MSKDCAELTTACWSSTKHPTWECWTKTHSVLGWFQARLRAGCTGDHCYLQPPSHPQVSAALCRCPLAASGHTECLSWCVIPTQAQQLQLLVLPASLQASLALSSSAVGFCPLGSLSRQPWHFPEPSSHLQPQPICSGCDLGNTSLQVDFPSHNRSICSVLQRNTQENQELCPALLIKAQAQDTMAGSSPEPQDSHTLLQPWGSLRMALLAQGCCLSTAHFYLFLLPSTYLSSYLLLFHMFNFKPNVKTLSIKWNTFLFKILWAIFIEHPFEKKKKCRDQFF